MQQACRAAVAAVALVLPDQVESGFLYSILWLKRMVLMTLGEGGGGGNPWHHLLGASLNLSNVYVSCYTHMQMELYCSSGRTAHPG